MVLSDGIRETSRENFVSSNLF